MVRYGLVGNFVVDEKMNIETIKTNLSNYRILLRKSIFRLLMWMQKTVLLSNEPLLIKERFSQGFTIDNELNKLLISYYQMMRNRYKEINISNENSKYSIDDIIGNKVYVLPYENKFLILVPVVHKLVTTNEPEYNGKIVKIEGEEHLDLVPLLSLRN